MQARGFCGFLVVSKVLGGASACWNWWLKVLAVHALGLGIKSWALGFCGFGMPSGQGLTLRGFGGVSASMADASVNGPAVQCMRGVASIGHGSMGVGVNRAWGVWVGGWGGGMGACINNIYVNKWNK